MLYDLLQKTAQDYPDRLAVICGETRLTFSQLKNRIDRLASGLKSLGIRKKEKIAVLHKNCHRFLETYFAAAKIGAILVPMNYRLSVDDFIYILDDSQANLLITQPDLVPRLLEAEDTLRHLERIIFTGSGRDSVSEYSFGPQAQTISDERNLDYESLVGGVNKKESEEGLVDKKNRDAVHDSDIAQIYYTSGTTGKPKGVILTHKNNRVHAVHANKELTLTQKDRWLHVSPMFHLADAWAVWAITKAGGTHVIVPEFEPDRILEAIERHRVTLSNFIPTMLNILVNSPGVRDYDCSSLRLILSGGAPIAKEVVRKAIDVFGCDYIQTYGLTETSPFLTMSILKDEMKSLPFEQRLRYMVTTGRPFYGVQLKVVREDGTEVTPDDGEVGEILAKGETVTPGYWHLPEETSERIVDGWLHTKDLAVINREGYLTIVDRMDDVIISGGENIYSVEVDDVLYAHPCILEAAVFGLSDPVWGERVTAAVVLKENENAGEDEIIDFCKERIAPFKAPKTVIFTDRLPKTGSAKICKYKLREKYEKEPEVRRWIEMKSEPRTKKRTERKKKGGKPYGRKL
ncbi:MAG: long-chain-fatty-acid--CoA ligase [Candidatus Aminicenantes bacterium]